LDDVLRAKLEEVTMTRDEFNIARSCLKELETLIGKLGPDWRVRPFGSLSNGFAIRGSDLDITCFRDGDVELFPTALEMLEHVLPLVESHKSFKIVDVIKAAMVPIVKLRFREELAVDLSFKNMCPLPNTQLLRAYSELPRVRELVVLVKLWARAAGVCGAADGHLSAYSFTLMAIYFMQVEPRLRMQCLDTALFTGLGSVPKDAKGTGWSCRWAASDLLLQFFSFYAREFQWGTEVVSIRLGSRRLVLDPAFEALKGRREERLHIEDPFQLGRNLHCVLRVENEYVLYQRLWAAVQAMLQGEVPRGLMPGRRQAPLEQGCGPAEPRKAHAEAQEGGARPAEESPDSDGPHAESSHGPRAQDVPLPALQCKWSF